MCGVAGIIDSNTVNVNLHRLQKMTDAIAHRGPDGEGFWISENGNVGFGHRRLSIIDLSDNAKQPMHYASNLTITYNGEIYNYIELKEQLQKKGYQFTTNSDTEVLLAMYHLYKEECLQYLDGMFAFAIYDAAQNEIFIARDRFGEKPLYYSYKPGQYFLFGSEMKALWGAGVTRDVNNEMLYNYLQSSFLENPSNTSSTFYNNCSKLPHSHYLKLNVANLKINVTRYYNLEYNKLNTTISIGEATEKFKDLLQNSISKRLRSDVAVGSSLSGGLDSSIIVSIINQLNKQGGNKQNAFSAIFPGFEKDEKKYIDAVVANKNIDTHFIEPTDSSFINDFQKLCWHHEEPFDGPSIYAQYCVMKLAKEKNVKVLLDGQGADEILAGYDYFYKSYFNQLKINNPSEYKIQFAAYKKLYNISRLKNSSREVIQAINPSLLNKAKKIQLAYNQMNNSFLSKEFFKENCSVNYDERTKSDVSFDSHLYKKTFVYGLQQLLQHADRNSMAHGVEVRLPFLNKELVEFLFQLPPQFKINNGYTKWVARKAFEDYLPHEIVWRKDKVAYAVPEMQWINNKNYIDLLYDAKLHLIKRQIVSKTIISKELVAKQNWKVLMSYFLYNT